MLKFSQRLAISALLAALVCTLPATVIASNGMYLTGYGIESVMMGGADVALSRDAFAATSNPSGLTQLRGQEVDIIGTGYVKQEYSHTDSFGNYRKPDASGIGGYGSSAYGQHDENSPYALGVSLTVQGGMGWTFRGVNTQPALGGKRDDLAAVFTIIKLAPAIGWEVNDQLSLGVALGVNYMSANQEFFPNTSAPPSAAFPQGFAGIRFKGASGIALNSKWGLQYRPAKDVTIGVTDGTQTSMPLKDGTLRINFSDPALGGFGVVRYDNAKLSGMRLPEELTLGVAFQPTPSLLVSVQDKWYNCAQYADADCVESPAPTPAPRLVIPSPANFSDQHVISIGLAYDYDKDTVLMAGVNHGSRPIPDQNVSPIFRPIPARHYMFGATCKINEEWRVAGGMEIIAFQSVTYDSQVFGPRANEHDYAFEFCGSISRR